MMSKAELLKRLEAVPEDAEIGCFYIDDSDEIGLGWRDGSGRGDVHTIVGGDA